MLFVFVFVGLPLFATCITKKNRERLNLKGLGLPEGSVRSMLALLIVGTYMIVALLGAGYNGGEDDDLSHLGEVPAIPTKSKIPLLAYPGCLFSEMVS